MLSKEEKQSRKVQKQNTKLQLQKRKQREKHIKRIGDRMERLISLFGILICVTTVILDVIDRKKSES